MVNPLIFSGFVEFTPPTMGRGFDVLGLSGSLLVALLLGPASAELELLALNDDDVSLRELVLNVLVLVLPVLLVLELLFPAPVLPLDFSLALNSLNFSNIEFLFCCVGILDFCEVGVGVEDCELRPDCLSGVADWLRGPKLRPPGVGIPEPAGEVARCVDDEGGSRELLPFVPKNIKKYS